MRYVSADRTQAGLYWGNALLVTLAMSSLIAAILWFTGPAATGNHDRLLFVVLVFANCLCFQIASMAGQVFQTFEKLRVTAILSFLTNFSRFIILLIMEFTLHKANAFQWALGVLIASLLAALLALICVRSEIKSIRFDLKLIFRRAWEGIGFSFAGTTALVFNDIDKTMLSHYGLNRENGFYTLAYRIVEFATAPITAMDAALQPRYFILSREGMAPIIHLVAKSLRVAFLLGVGIACTTMLLSPLVPRLVGHDYSGVVTALRWLCWIPLLRGVHRMTGVVLTGTGHQNLRTAAQFMVAVVNVSLNILWIPRFGWIAAAWTSLMSDGLLAVLNSGSLYWILRHLPRNLALEPETVTSSQ
jgi:O-antigen/teichoic acid export membrane protein